MDIKKVEQDIARLAKPLKKDFSGRGPIYIRAAIKGNTVTLKVISDFTDLELYLLHLMHRFSVLEDGLRVISEEVMKPQFDPVFKEYDSELEIVEITTEVSGERYADQLTIMVLNKDFEQIIKMK